MSQLWSLIIRVVEESSGNDPQSVSHRSHCLANKSRRLQGLLSICVHDGLRSHYLRRIRSALYQLSYVNLCGLGRGRTYDLRVNRSLLCHWATSPFCCGSRWNRTTKTMFYRHDQDPADTPFCTLYRDRTCDLLYVKQPLLPSELRVLVLVFLNKSNHFLV